MPTTGTLPEARERARATDPETSHEAAAASGRDLSKMQAIVLELFETIPDEVGPGMTDSELCARYDNQRDANGWPVVRYETPRKRRSDLARMKRLRDSELRRLNAHGQAEVVWEVAA